MGRYPVLRTQKNDVKLLLEDIGLNLQEFEWNYQQSEISPNCEVEILVHRPTGYYFKFDADMENTDRVSIYTPGIDQVRESGRHGNWNTQTRDIVIWATSLKREVDAPDLWAAIGQERQLLETSSSPETSNAPFSQQEQESISIHVREVGEYLKRVHQISDHNWSYVRPRLDYLVESSARLGRKDWLNIAINTLISIVVALALPSNAASDLFLFFKNTVRTLFGGTPLLP